MGGRILLERTVGTTPLLLFWLARAVHSHLLSSRTLHLTGAFLPGLFTHRPTQEDRKKRTRSGVFFGVLVEVGPF